MPPSTHQRESIRRLDISHKRSPGCTQPCYCIRSNFSIKRTLGSQTETDQVHHAVGTGFMYTADVLLRDTTRALASVVQYWIKRLARAHGELPSTLSIWMQHQSSIQYQMYHQPLTQFADDVDEQLASYAEIMEQKRSLLSALNLSEAARRKAVPDLPMLLPCAMLDPQRHQRRTALCPPCAVGLGLNDVQRKR